MKINKGTVKNINKKLIASLLAVSLTTCLAGCETDLAFGLEPDLATSLEKGEITYKNASFSSLKKYKVVIFELYGKQAFYLVEPHTRIDGSILYYNIFDNQSLHDTLDDDTSLSILEEFFLCDWLVINNMVQTEYTEQELKNILNQIKEDYKEEKDKQLVIGN